MKEILNFMIENPFFGSLIMFFCLSGIVIFIDQLIGSDDEIL